jgi:2-polyprenyl-3-methyl-5-hydroxy-6-metoxy-1,4-benzoquinol methylase
MKLNEYTFNSKREISYISQVKVVDSFTSVNSQLCDAGFNYSYCSAEDSYFINPQPDIKSLQGFYNGHGALIDYQTLERDHIDYKLNPRRQKLLTQISSYVTKYKTSGRWLDYGCGAGLLLLHNKENFDVFGIEISKVAAEFLSKKGISVKSSLQFVEGSFDVISAIDVIEHVSEPIQFLYDIKSKLKKNGIILLRLPVIDGVRFNSRRPQLWKWVMAPYHLHLFSIKTITLAAKKAKLSIEIIDDPELKCDIDGIVLRYTKFALLQNKIGRRLIRVIAVLISPYYFRRYRSDCIFAVLRKV